jgi:hypothetical protein
MVLISADAPAQKTSVPPIVLTGIVELPAASNAPGVKRAFLELGSRDNAVSCSLAEGQKSGDLRVLHINSSHGSVTVGYQGQVFTLSFDAQAHRQRVLLAAERQKDVSHTEYHTTRARLDRERDAAEHARQAR